MPQEPFPMGTIIAERRIVAYEKNGEERGIVVRLGAPVRVNDLAGLPHFRCPLQIEGLDVDGRVYPAGGGDAFEAMQYAIDFAGDLLNGGYAHLELENRTRTDSSMRDHWIWRYKAQP